MTGASAVPSLPHRRFFRPALGCALLLAGFPSLAAAWVPLVELKFETGTTTTPNSGSAGGSATLSTPTPSFSTNIPTSGGTRSLDFGTAEGHYYADLTSSNVLNAVKNLKSFTIAGWVNCRSSQTNFGGGRIVSWYKWENGGVDLAFRSDGSLGLGVNAWNDQDGVTSSPAKIPVDVGASYNNWRFIAVSYDGTTSSGNVKFYFGTNNVPAALDKAVTLDKGASTGTIAPSLTIGNVPSDQRNEPFTSVFRGLIDQVRIYGSTANSSGVLTLDQIQALQQASPLVNVQGVVYEQWNGISGNSLSALLSDPRYPFNPSLTKLQANFEKLSSGEDNYGARVSGWVKAPATGSYTFWIVGDDNAELRVSTDANPGNKRLVASVATYNSTPDSWTQYGSQQSEPIALQANQYYYVEALVKEGVGGDYVRVGWQLPNGTLERPIPQSRVATTPPDAVTFYPSAYPLFEPGSYVKKAEMGWQKEEGNDHFYIKTDDAKALVAKNGTAYFPDRLFFGGKFLNDLNQNDLGFRWDRSTVGEIGTLHLETQGGRWALRVESGSEMEPNVEFNRQFTLTGPGETDTSGNSWAGFASDHYFYGGYRERERLGMPAGDSYKEWAHQNSAGMSVYMHATSDGFSEAESTVVAAGRVEVMGKDPAIPYRAKVKLSRYGLVYDVFDDNGVVSWSTIYEGGFATSKNVAAAEFHGKSVHADSLFAANFVTTPKWKISADLPDYVFEKDYKLRSLEETERFVRTRKHLPEIPSAKEMSEKGIDLTDMNIKLLKKVEELTLHMIALDKELKAQRRDNHQLKQEVRALRGAGKGN